LFGRSAETQPSLFDALRELAVIAVSPFALDEHSDLLLE
jgi:hypothetical protein